MKPGTVFKWNKFPTPKLGGELKSRWFIYLGDTGILSKPILAHFSTTTTSVYDFKSGGNRVSHRYFSLKKTKYPFFDEDCILDYDEVPYSEQKRILEINTDIEVKGHLDREGLRSIYNGILRSQFYSPKILIDIHSSLNQIGITGLTKP